MTEALLIILGIAITIIIIGVVILVIQSSNKAKLIFDREVIPYVDEKEENK